LKQKVCRFQLNEMRSQLELRDSQIHELRRLYKDARDGESRNADVVRQLRVELARWGTSAAGTINSVADGMIQQRGGELRERVVQLESQLRFAICSLRIT